MSAIKGSHIALFMSGICSFLVGATFLVDASSGPSSYPSSSSSDGSGEKVPNLHAASNDRTFRHLQASIAGDGMGGTVIRLPPIDIVANETDPPLVEEGSPVTFVCEATHAPVEVKR